MVGRNKESKKMAALTLTIVILIIMGKVIYASVVYGDWACAIARCVKNAVIP